MNKAQLIDLIAKHTELSRSDSGRALNVALDVIRRAVHRGEDVTLIDFGTFSLTEKKHFGYNPMNGDEVEISPKYFFKPDIEYDPPGHIPVPGFRRLDWKRQERKKN